MPIISTQPLVVKQIISTSPTSGQFTLVLTTPFVSPQFLGGVVIMRKASGPISGTITFGTDSTHGGRAVVNANTTTFSDLRALAVLPVKAVVSYEGTSVVGLDLLPGAATVSAGSPPLAPLSLAQDESQSAQTPAE